MIRREEFGLRIREARTKRGMSVKELAAKASVSVSYIYSIEAGVRGSHIDKLTRIAHALDLRLTDIWS